MQTRRLVSLVPNRLALANERIAFVAPLVFDVTAGCEASAVETAVTSEAAASSLAARLGGGGGGGVASKPPVPGPLRRTINVLYV
jgi:hypothetical protein